MATRLRREAEQDKQALEQIAWAMENESDELVNEHKDGWVTDTTASSFGLDRLRLSQALRAWALVIRAFVKTYVK